MIRIGAPDAAVLPRERFLCPAAPRWVFLIPMALAVLAVAVPFLLRRGSFLPAVSLHYGFSLICHQHPERSFRIFGMPVAVCARCLGIYLGAAVGLLFRTSRRIAIQLLIAAATLNLLDVVTEFAGLHGNWISIRLVLGIALGVAGGMVIVSAMAQSPRRSPHGTMLV